MSRDIAICSLMLFLFAATAAAQEPNETRDSGSASQYTLKQPSETHAQRQRRLREDTARELVFERAAKRATRRDDRIAAARALGISHARPDVQRSIWLDTYLLTLPRIIYVELFESAEPSPGNAARDSRRY